MKKCILCNKERAFMYKVHLDGVIGKYQYWHDYLVCPDCIKLAKTIRSLKDYEIDIAKRKEQ